jgi:hypothetical protein
MSQYLSVEGALEVLLKNALITAETRKCKGRLDAGQIDIDFDYLLNIWNSQKGACYYTGMPLNFDKNEWRVSIERTNPSLGYIQGNVVLTCIELNSSVQWSHEKIDTMLGILDQNISEHLYDMKHSPKVRKPLGNSQKYIINEKIYYNCRYCDEVKEADLFLSNCHHGCKDCRQKYWQIYKTYPSERLNKMYRATLRTTEYRKKQNNPKRDCSHDIDLMYINQLYFEQKGLCAYSKLPMKFEGDDWICSIERIDVFKGYTRGNICLVCKEFNVSDYSVIMTTTECGNSGWTKLKFEYFLAYVKYTKKLISKEELDAVVELQVVYKSRLEVMGISKPTTSNTPYTNRIPNQVSTRVSSILTQAKRNYGKIYMITSPSGKKFVGQTDVVFKSNESILIDIKRKHYTAVMREMNTYEDVNMKVETLLVCRKDTLDHYRDFFIAEYKTNRKNHLNSRRKQSQETRQQISNSLIENVKRVGHDGRELPKYVKFHDWKDRQGYAIINCHRFKKKDFVSKKFTLEENYQRCIEYLNQLNI